MQGVKDHEPIICITYLVYLSWRLLLPAISEDYLPLFRKFHASYRRCEDYALFRDCLGHIPRSISIYSNSAEIGI